MMTMHWTDLILVAAFVGAGYAAGYLILLRKIRHVLIERDLKLADQMAALDDAIRALESRLAEHRAGSASFEDAQRIAGASSQEDAQDAEDSEAVAPVIQAVITAAAATALGQDVHIRSMKPATSSWSQQGRVLVQGSHNARARR